VNLSSNRLSRPITHPIYRAILAAFIGGAALLSITGCADMLTYAKDAKRDGIQQYNDGKYADAVGSFKNAARQDPTDPDTEYWLGLSFEQNKDYHEAIVAYNE